MNSTHGPRPRVLTIGEGFVVLVAQPGPLEASESFHRAIGGAEANVAIVLAQLGVDTGWISRVGDDGFGRYLVKVLADRGIDTSAVTVDGARSTAVYVKERGSGSAAPHDLPAGSSRMTYYRTGSAGSALSPADTPEPLLETADLIHFSGITAAISDSANALADALIARAAGKALISFDLNYRPALWRNRSADPAEVLARYVRGADVVFLGSDEAELVFGTGDPAQLRAMFPEPQHLVIKNDAHAAVGYLGDTVIEVPALRVAVTEPIGAGDAFAGGYLGAMLLGKPHRQLLRFGHLCAAAALGGAGDHAELPSRQELEAIAELGESDWGRIDLADSSASPGRFAGVLR